LFGITAFEERRNNRRQAEALCKFSELPAQSWLFIGLKEFLLGQASEDLFKFFFFFSFCFSVSRQAELTAIEN